MLEKFNDSNISPEKFVDKARNFKSVWFNHMRGVSHRLELMLADSSSSSPIDEGLKLLNNSHSRISINSKQLESTDHINILTGTIARDKIIGTNVNDHINAGNNNDILTGGLGADRFVMSQGNDVITDFSATDGDMIEISNVNNLSLTQVSNDLVLSNSAGNLTIKDYSADISDFKIPMRSRKLIPNK